LNYTPFTQYKLLSSIYSSFQKMKPINTIFLLITAGTLTTAQYDNLDYNIQRRHAYPVAAFDLSDYDYPLYARDAYNDYDTDNMDLLFRRNPYPYDESDPFSYDLQSRDPSRVFGAVRAGLRFLKTVGKETGKDQIRKMTKNRGGGSGRDESQEEHPLVKATADRKAAEEKAEKDAKKRKQIEVLSGKN
jgi:hypothetical protein